MPSGIVHLQERGWIIVKNVMLDILGNGTTQINILFIMSAFNVRFQNVLLVKWGQTILHCVKCVKKGMNCSPKIQPTLHYNIVKK